jgi:hypothetical protein
MENGELPQQVDLWPSIEVRIDGREGTGSGKSGTGSTSREVSMEMGIGIFLQVEMGYVKLGNLLNRPS